MTGRARPWEPCRPGGGAGSARGPPHQEAPRERMEAAQSRGLALEKSIRGWVHHVLRQKNQ